VPDRQLACAPVLSAEGRGYLGAMAAAANYGRANRQLLGEATRRVFESAAGVTLDLVYDVSHNLAKIENHDLDGASRTLCVHRKGATLALPPGHEDLPDDLRSVGQPVFIPGTMGTASYVLVGVARAFNSTAHGAARAGRHQCPASGRSRRWSRGISSMAVAGERRERQGRRGRGPRRAGCPQIALEASSRRSRKDCWARRCAGRLDGLVARVPM
jgi:tRNA-splicing ligase RtcB